MKQLKIENHYVIQSVSDDEGAVRNCMRRTFPNAGYSTCLAHKIQTTLKHGLALASKEYKRDPFPLAFEFWERVRGLVSVHTKNSLNS